MLAFVSGLLHFLPIYLCGLILWLLAYGGVQLAVCFRQMSMTEFLIWVGGVVGWTPECSWEEPSFLSS